MLYIFVHEIFFSFPTLYDLARIVDSISAGFNTQLEVNEVQ